MTPGSYTSFEPETCEVQVRALMTMGNWRTLEEGTFTFGFEAYRATPLILNGREYRAPWRVMRGREVIFEHGGGYNG